MVTFPSSSTSPLAMPETLGVAFNVALPETLHVTVTASPEQT
jgi:hypothetical protein